MLAQCETGALNDTAELPSWRLRTTLATTCFRAVPALRVYIYKYMYMYRQRGYLIVVRFSDLFSSAEDRALKSHAFWQRQFRRMKRRVGRGERWQSKMKGRMSERCCDFYDGEQQYQYLEK